SSIATFAPPSNSRNSTESAVRSRPTRAVALPTGAVRVSGCNVIVISRTSSPRMEAMGHTRPGPPSRRPGLDRRAGPLVDGADLEAPAADARVWRQELDRVVEVPGLEDQDAPEVFLGLGEGPAGDGDLPVPEPQGHGIAGLRERLAAEDMPAAAQLDAVGDALLQEG